MSWRKLLVSKLGLFLLLAAFCGMVYLLAGEIDKRYSLEKEIRSLSAQIREIEASNTELANMIDYFSSISFQERELRQKLNLQRPGEHVVVLPALNATNSAPQSQILPTGPASEEPNWKLWWNYFFKQ
jgi:hypothetical protein